MFGLKLITSIFLVSAVTGQSLSGLEAEMRVPDCGKTYSSDPSDGVVAEFKQPWLVELRPLNIWLSRPLKCAGVLVTARFVLTAAQCVDGLEWYSIKIRVGNHGLEQLQETYPYEEYGTLGKNVHRGFKAEGESRYSFDLALIELSSPVRFRKHILPACLPRDRRWIGENGTVSEMGAFELARGSRTLSPRTLDMQIIENKFCTTLPGTLDPDDYSYWPMCVRFQEPACREHQILAGLPLIFEENGRAIAIGIASWSEPCYLSSEQRKPGGLTVFMSVSRVMDWITYRINVGVRGTLSEHWEFAKFFFTFLAYAGIYMLCKSPARWVLWPLICVLFLCIGSLIYEFSARLALQFRIQELLWKIMRSGKPVVGAFKYSRVCHRV